MSDLNINSIKECDIRSISKIISKIENEYDDRILSDIFTLTGKAYKIGITGPPGAGKSTITNLLINKYRKINKKVAVLGVDPSSPFSGGALLGDRVRMLDHHQDSGVYIRSMATRGSNGGLADKTQEIGDILDAAGFDIIIFETVGVGQIELDIMEISDVVLVVLVPESGDDIQMMKAGLMEIGDIFIINKSDRPDAKKIEISINQILSLSKNNKDDLLWDSPVINTVGIKNKGINLLFKTINEYRSYYIKEGIKDEKFKKRYITKVKNIIKDSYVKSFWTKNKIDLLSESLDKKKENWLSPNKLAKILIND